MVQFWSADQVQIDSRGIRIRHRDSDHPETVETVIKAAQLPGARGPNGGVVPNIALPPPKDFAREIPMPRGPPLNVGTLWFPFSSLLFLLCRYLKHNSTYCALLYYYLSSLQSTGAAVSIITLLLSLFSAEHRRGGELEKRAGATQVWSSLEYLFNCCA